MTLDRKTITGPQIRAARSLIGISAEELSRCAGLGIATVWRAESAEGEPTINQDSVAAIRGALEGLGVKFLEATKAGGVGVRLRE
jgi:transcriptional regulator with XRE-family HTH domain